MALAKFYEKLEEARWESGARQLVYTVYGSDASNERVFFDESPRVYQAMADASKQEIQPKQRSRRNRKGKED